jgi:multidrug efflux pump subunit AcrA (membrane-fusion protein)
MSEYQRKSESAGRRGAWQLGGVFAALLAVLMFFSGTIYQYNLPQVTASKPFNGYLNKKETASGNIDWENIAKVYSPVAATLSEVCFEEGDWVAAGQVMFRLSYDRSEAERKLKEIDNNLKKLEIDIQGINLRMEKTQRSIADYRASQAEARRLYEKERTKETTSNDLQLVDIDIRKAEQTLTDTRTLYEAGAATGREVKSAEESLEVLYLKRESTIRAQQEQSDKESDALDSLRRNISTYDKPLADCLADITQYELDLESRSRDFISYDLQREPYLEALDSYDAHGEILSAADGEILSIPVEEGQKINENALVATIGEGHNYIIECTISIDNNFIFPGDVCELSNTMHILYGDIISLTPGERGKAVKIGISSDEVTVGESFNLTFERRSEIRYTLVQNGALHQDSDGYYLNRVKKSNGLLGREFVLDRIDVNIGDSDLQNTVITGGIRFFEPIALTSDKPVSPGDIIKLMNEADFFAD